MISIRFKQRYHYIILITDSPFWIVLEVRYFCYLYCCQQYSNIYFSHIHNFSYCKCCLYSKTSYIRQNMQCSFEVFELLILPLHIWTFWFEIYSEFGIFVSLPLFMWIIWRRQFRWNINKFGASKSLSHYNVDTCLLLHHNTLLCQ